MFTITIAGNERKDGIISPRSYVYMCVYNIHSQRQRVINIPVYKSDKRSFLNAKARIKKNTDVIATRGEKSTLLEINMYRYA